MTATSENLDELTSGELLAYSMEASNPKPLRDYATVARQVVLAREAGDGQQRKRLAALAAKLYRKLPDALKFQ